MGRNADTVLVFKNLLNGQVSVSSEDVSLEKTATADIMNVSIELRPPYYDCIRHGRVMPKSRVNAGLLVMKIK
jgi:hypothetical protein